MLTKEKPLDEVTKILGELIMASKSVWVKGKINKSFTEEQFLERPIPKKDVSTTFSGIPLRGYDSQLDQCREILKAKRVTNSIYYPPKTMLPWHTNSDLEGIRTYYTFSIDGGIFRYKDVETGEIVSVQDDIGWNVNQFKISKDDLFWHTIWAKGRRFSFGFLS